MFLSTVVGHGNFTQQIWKSSYKVLHESVESKQLWYMHINCYCMLIKSLAMTVVNNLRIILVKHKVKLILTERVLSFGRKLYPKELEIPWNVTIG